MLLSRQLHAYANYLCGVEYAMQLQAYPLRGNFMEFFAWFVGECPPKGKYWRLVVMFIRVALEGVRGSLSASLLR